ncbi:hypothetical protein EIN_134440 [Entamoeba invadens IP1]|uniref:Uncharacterized protein n=1 Tax=Entamoeba invadens IP1 TaxID=370355 RepID=A0A0A1TX67_ENTIV|nr:hypothetical protein EIN_134440 [Entamoeba invadens IP1]ELP85900.1 hypothetical protein EIN_134440 [Entamoeba invadens IP1]|eukprot:XP_004185246.1 hypothetical protein EIN_134440 [Entamoeba invadens IP1]
MMMKMKMNNLKFPCPLHVLIDGPSEQTETDAVMRMLVSSDLYDKAIYSASIHIERCEDAVYDILKNKEILRNIDEHLVYTSTSLESTLIVLVQLTNIDPEPFLEMKSFNKVLQLLNYQMEYNNYLNILDCLDNFVSSHEPEVIISLIENNLLDILIDGMNSDDDEEEWVLCGSILRECLSIEDVQNKLANSFETLWGFLVHLSQIYQNVLVKMQSHVFLICLCECIEHLTRNSEVSQIIRDKFPQLLL